MRRRMTIRKAAPKAEEAISYMIPTFKLRGNLVHFTAYKNHIGFYPGSRVIDAFRDWQAWASGLECAACR